MPALLAALFYSLQIPNGTGNEYHDGDYQYQALNRRQRRHGKPKLAASSFSATMHAYRCAFHQDRVVTAAPVLPLRLHRGD
jgi:hypothetical protein